MTTIPPRATRTIRSFVRRSKGKRTPTQDLAFKALWARYGVSFTPSRTDGFLDLGTLFQKPSDSETKRVLEIGFGDGNSLATMAADHPEKDFIGIEVYENGITRLLSKLNKMNLSNVRIFHHDAVEVLTHCIPDCSLDTIQIFFADPWPKARHHKRRLIQTPFITLIAQKLKRKGILHLATDWMDYAYQMMSVLSASDYFENLAGEGQFTPRPHFRPLTKYEQRGLKLGHKTWDLLFQRTEKC